MTRLQKSQQLVFLCCLISGCFVSAAEDLTLSQAEELVVDQDRELSALASSMQQFNELGRGSRALPAPQVRIGLMNFPIEHGGFQTEAMTQINVGVRQNIPPKGQRRAHERMFENRTLEMMRQYRARENDNVYAVRIAWLEAYYQDEALQLLEATNPLLQDLVEIAQSRYSVGEQQQQDVLHAELKLFEFNDRLEQARQWQRESYSKLWRLIGNPQSSIKVAGELPDWSETPTQEEIETYLVDHSLVQQFDAEAASLEAAKTVEETHLRPAWSINIGYGYRDGALPSQRPRSDLLSASVGFSLPIVNSSGPKHRIRGLTSQISAVEDRQALLLQDLTTEAEIAVSRWESLTTRLEVYEESIKSHAQELASVALVAYKNKTAELSDVTQSLIAEIDTSTAHLRLVIDRLQTWAKIDWLVEGNR